MLLFKFKYDEDPITFMPTKQARSRANDYMGRAMKRFRKKNKAPKMIGKGMRQGIQSLAEKYGFNFGSFLHDNFKSKNKNMLLKVHNDLFKGMEANNPWCCDKYNYRQILFEIRKEAKDIQAMPRTKLDQTSVGYPKSDDQLKKTAKQKIKEFDAPAQKDDSDIEVHPLTSNVRSKLQALWHPYDPHRYTFTATLKGYKISSHDALPAALLKDVYHAGEEVSTHNWIFRTNRQAIINSGATAGDKIAFSALVTMYKKHKNSNAVCDFNLDCLKNVHVIVNKNITPDNDKPKPLSNNVLIKALGKLYDRDQIISLIHMKQKSNNKNINSLHKRLVILKKRTNVLQLQFNKLSKETDSSQSIISNAKNECKESLIKKNSQLHIQKVHTIDAKQYNLLGSTDMMKAITKLWLKKPIKGNYNYIQQNRIRGISKRLKGFMKSLKDDHESLNLDNGSITLDNIEKVAKAYQLSELRALIEYMYRGEGTTISSIEKHNHLSAGTLLKIRRSNKAHQALKDYKSTVLESLPQNELDLITNSNVHKTFF